MLNKKGFTIIELVIVLTIIGVIITISVSSMANTMPHLRLKSAVNELVANINLARMIAISRNRSCVISFNKADNEYTIFIDDDAAGKVKWHLDNGEEVIISKKAPAGVTMAKASFSRGTSEFGYDGNGFPLENRIGSVCLKNEKDEYHKISVSWAGRAKLFRNARKSECR